MFKAGIKLFKWYLQRFFDGISNIILGLFYVPEEDRTFGNIVITWLHLIVYLAVFLWLVFDYQLLEI